MVINRLDLIRVLKIVKSSGQNEVKFEEDGSFGIAYTDGCGLLFGKGLKFGKKIALLDIDMLIKMLDSFTAMEVNVEIDDTNRMSIAGGDVRYGYRLADWDLVEGIEQKYAEKMEQGWNWVNGVLQFEDLNRIRKLVKTLSVGKISFKEEQGKLTVCVGDKKMFFGEIMMSAIGLKEEVHFEAVKMDDMIGVLDEGKIGFNVGMREGYDDNIKQKYVEGLLKIANGGFVWYLGSLKSE